MQGTNSMFWSQFMLLHNVKTWKKTLLVYLKFSPFHVAIHWNLLDKEMDRKTGIIVIHALILALYGQ